MVSIAYITGYSKRSMYLSLTLHDTICKFSNELSAIEVGGGGAPSVGINIFKKCVHYRNKFNG